jgi:hypothetical protein
MTARRNTRRLAILSVLAIAVAGSIAAGCGSKYVSVDKKNEQRVAAAWLGESNGRPTVSCRRHVCEIGIRQPFVDASEAWLLIVPITTYFRGPDFPGVDRIILRVTDERRGQVAVFRCSLPKALPDNKTWQKTTDVRDAREMCKSSVVPTKDS